MRDALELSKEKTEILIAYFENEIRSHSGPDPFDLNLSLVAKELQKRDWESVTSMIRERHEIICERHRGESDLAVRDGFAALLVAMLLVVH